MKTIDKKKAVRTRVRVPRPPVQGLPLTVNISFWLDEDVARQLASFCFERRLNKSAICRDAVIFYMERVKAQTNLVYVEKP